MSELKSIEKTLELDARLKPSIVNGCKTTTIRKGHRHFARNITIGNMSAVVNNYKHYILMTAPLSVLVNEGFKSVFDAIHKLQKYYPDISLSTPITVVEFRLEVIDGGSTHPIDKAVKEWLE